MAVAFQSSSCVYLVVKFLVPLKMLRLVLLALRVIFQKYIVSIAVPMQVTYSIRGDRRMMLTSK